MARRASRYYNDPQIGAIFENIAGMFGPPDSGELVNYAQAAGLRQKNDIIAQLRGDPRYKGADAGVLAGLFNPTQSWTALEMGDATTRRGQDITAATSRANNLQDNQFRTISDMYGPLNQGQLRPELPVDMTDFMGLPAMPAVAGAPKPMTENEVMGSELQRLIEAGTITDDDLTAKTLSDIPVENIVGEGGRPVTVRRSDAVGAEPYFNRGAEAKPENAIGLLPDGQTQVPAIQGEGGAWFHAQTGERLPDDVRIFKVPQAQGSAADVGLTKPTNTYIEQQLIDIGSAKNTAVGLRDLIAQAPASQGFVGWLRGTAQNVVQVGGELGQFFGGEIAQVAKDIENGLADADLAGAFDPNIPAIDMMANLLAFQYAKTTTGERLSNEMLRNAKAALGLEGLDANQANSIARLNQAIAQIEAQEQMLLRVREQGIGAASSPAPAAPAQVSADGVPAGWDPEDWKFLTPEEQQQVLGGL